MTRIVENLPSVSYTVVPLTSVVTEESPYIAEVFSGPPAPLRVMILLICITMIIVTIVGNALVCLAVLLVRKLQQPHNFLIVSLAMADCLVGVIVMPLALADMAFKDWPLGRFMCKLWTTADLFLCTASIVNLCIISVDRYLVISRPLRYAAVRTSSRILFYIVIVWLLAALVSLSSHIIGNLLDDQGMATSESCQVIQHFAYQIYATIIAFYGPTIIMVILYIQIWRAAKRLARQDRILSVNNGCSYEKNGNGHRTSDIIEPPPAKKTSASKIFKVDRKYLHRPSALLHAVKVPLIRQHDGHDCKARKTLGVMMSVFIVCWFPFFFLAILKSCFSVDVPYWLDTLTLWLGYSNSMLNPAIYCKYNKEFRVPFREILSCRCRTLQHVIRQQTFTSRYGPTIKLRTVGSSVHSPLLPRRSSSQAECSDV